MKGAPGMPLGTIALVRPCFLIVGQVSGGASSIDGQPRSLATWHIRSMSQLSPAILKHQ